VNTTQHDWFPRAHAFPRLYSCLDTETQARLADWGFSIATLTEKKSPNSNGSNPYQQQQNNLHFGMMRDGLGVAFAIQQDRPSCLVALTRIAEQAAISDQKSMPQRDRVIAIEANLILLSCGLPMDDSIDFAFRQLPNEIQLDSFEALLLRQLFYGNRIAFQTLAQEVEIRIESANNGEPCRSILWHKLETMRCLQQREYACLFEHLTAYGTFRNQYFCEYPQEIYRRDLFDFFLHGALAWASILGILP